MKKSKVIAVAVYLEEGYYLHSKELYTKKEVEAVRDGEDEDVGEWKSYLVLGENLETESHT